MKVYVVYYDEVYRGREGPEVSRQIEGIYVSVEKAREMVATLSKKSNKHISYANYDVFEVVE